MIKNLNPDAKAGLLLALAALIGLLFENIGALRPLYDSFLNVYFTVAIGEAGISKPVLLWINDGLMAIFFLYVALEIKREAYEGSLSTWKRAALPVYGAIGGLVMPAMVFLYIVGWDAVEARGWAIPAATDIAFALGVLSLFGNRVPEELKTFLLALAVVDDLAAIMIIAAFYTAQLSILALSLAGLAGTGLFVLNFMGVKRLTPYVLLGAVLWCCVLNSGVHATLAGVALGFAIPLTRNAKGKAPAIEFEHALHPWIVFMIMPLFAFANAGVPLEGLSFELLMQPLTLAVILGLFLGKQIGVFGSVWVAIKLGIAEAPQKGSMAQLYGVSMLAGIGFTMSLFIGALAFSDQDHQTLVRIGVIFGSLLSGVAGSVVLSFANKRNVGASLASNPT